jgi:hypothetical protein
VWNFRNLQPMRHASSTVGLRCEVLRESLRQGLAWNLQGAYAKQLEAITRSYQSANQNRAVQYDRRLSTAGLGHLGGRRLQNGIAVGTRAYLHS